MSPCPEIIRIGVWGSLERAASRTSSPSMPGILMSSRTASGASRRSVSGPEGIETLRREAPDAVLLDIKMPGMDGLEVLEAARSKDPHTPILMISGHGDIPIAVEAIQKGAYDFLEKPLESERVLTALRNAIERRRLREENVRLRHQVEARYELVGRSPALAQVRETIARAAPSHATVLITGESGSGKELIAWEIHHRSPRA